MGSHKKEQSGDYTSLSSWSNKTCLLYFLDKNYKVAQKCSLIFYMKEENIYAIYSYFTLREKTKMWWELNVNQWSNAVGTAVGYQGSPKNS